MHVCNKRNSLHQRESDPLKSSYSNGKYRLSVCVVIAIAAGPRGSQTRIGAPLPNQTTQRQPCPREHTEEWTEIPKSKGVKGTCTVITARPFLTPGHRCSQSRTGGIDWDARGYHLLRHEHRTHDDGVTVETCQCPTTISPVTGPVGNGVNSLGG